MTKNLYSWQKVAFDRFKKSVCFMLNVCCGGGKTLVAIKIALFKCLPVIVIAPKALCAQWKNDLIEDGVDEADIWVYEQPEHTKRKTAYEAEVEAWLRD